MEYLLTIVLLLIIGGCETSEPLIAKGIHNRNIEVVKYDGCEYLILHGFREKSIVHKGNCSNTFHFKGE